MGGRGAGRQSLEAAEGDGTGERDLSRARGVRQAQGTGQGGLGGALHHVRADGGGAGAGRALESRGHRAVAATVAAPAVPVQHSGRGHGCVNLSRMSRGGFGTGTRGGTAGNNWSRLSRGGVAPDH